jgi:2-phospho-L-lactate/phosphoenolpyruvate guanylyltransferase
MPAGIARAAESGKPAQAAESGEAEPNAAVLVPVKAFREAKLRLAPALGPAERHDLARAMATHVLQAAVPLPVAVVCDDDEVATWAVDRGAQVIWRPGRGLNGAVTDGVEALRAEGVDRVIVAHADLPHALDLAWIARFAGVTLVPDRREDGTNVIGVPAGAGFTFAYGPGSFARHRLEAARLGVPVRIEREPRLGWDVDVPGDLVAPDWTPAG